LSSSLISIEEHSGRKWNGGVTRNTAVTIQKCFGSNSKRPRKRAKMGGGRTERNRFGERREKPLG